MSPQLIPVAQVLSREVRLLAYLAEPVPVEPPSRVLLEERYGFTELLREVLGFLVAGQVRDVHQPHRLPGENRQRFDGDN